MVNGAAPARNTTGGRRAARREEILTATRRLFDERGSRDAQIEDIAREVGINRAIIYRHFDGKEELFAEITVQYLKELGERLRPANSAGSPPDRLGAMSDAIIDFGLDYPAFVDCALTLQSRPGDELMAEVGEDSIVKLGAAMVECLNYPNSAIKDGVADGVFDVPDLELLSNLFYSMALGVLSLARLSLSVRELGEGRPTIDSVPIAEIKRYARLASVAAARGA